VHLKVGFGPCGEQQFSWEPHLEIALKG
jgi:hypothetical protein